MALLAITCRCFFRLNLIQIDADNYPEQSRRGEFLISVTDDSLEAEEDEVVIIIDNSLELIGRGRGLDLRRKDFS